MKKVLNIGLALIVLFATCSCTIQIGNGTSDGGNQGQECSVLDLDSINEYLNSGDLSTSGRGNVIAVIPITHINGPKDIDQFYAFIDFKYKARNYIKYQITYLSCTCRSANVNYWQTAYVEITLPESKNINDAKIKFLSFDGDSGAAGDDYIAGFWGDTGTTHPMPGTNVVYEKSESILKDGSLLPVSEQISIKEEFISFFIGKTGAYISSIAGCSDTVGPVDNINPDDFKVGEGRENYSLDDFVGASVSTNNIVLMLDALFQYHATDSFFTK